MDILINLSTTLAFGTAAVLCFRAIRRHKIALRQTHIQCECCRDWCSVGCVSFEVCRVNGQAVPICAACDPELDVRSVAA